MKRCMYFVVAMLAGLALCACIPMEKYTTAPTASPSGTATPTVSTSPEPSDTGTTSPSPSVSPSDSASPSPSGSASPSSSSSQESSMVFNSNITPTQTSVKVYKAKQTLELYGDGQLIGTADCIVGRNAGHKQQEGDERTPVGEYYVVTRNDQSNYTLFFGLNYPNASDAQRGKGQGLITAAQYDELVEADKNKERPLWDTDMGGWIGIHGKREGRTGTQGCIAVNDEDILVIGKYLKIGSKVTIYE